ncbi:MAG: hypothetical protein RLZZ298_273 [Pseudomonadota bacterium]|jgi:transcriptional regulator with XRE-family HTH domain
MGRTSFKVDRHLLRDLRNKQRLTQAEVAERVGIHLTRYQNIEWEGTTSPKTADKLAKLFGISVGALQQGLEAPAPRDYLQQIEQKIREELAKGENLLLQQVLQQSFAETRFTSGSSEENREDAIRYLAEDIAQRIEAVQLVQNKKEIADLVKLTGIAEAELLRPANVEGHWFINVFESWKTDPNAPPDEFNIRSEVTQRASSAIRSIEKAIKESSSDPLECVAECTDQSVKLSQDGFWYKVEVKLPLRITIRIDLVRCQPDNKGIRWIKPTWRDEYLIREPLIDWAKANFNFVCDFDGKQSPSGDVCQLRLLVTEYNQSSPCISYQTGRMVISGNLEDMHDELVASLREQDKTHSVAQRLLTNDLKCSLAPFLNDYPRECWSMSGLRIQLDENKSKDRKRPLLERFWGAKYSIQLVEQVGEQFEPVPWREKDRQSLQVSIQEMLDDPNDPAWATNEPRRAFTPYSAEP